MTDEEEAELDDLDEDENKDTRMTEYRWNKRVRNDAEFEASDDEDMSRANGATLPKARKQGFTDSRKGETDVESDHGTPRDGKSNDTSEKQADEDLHDANDDTIEDIGAAQNADKESVKNAEPQQPEKPQVDEDGDVGMTDHAPVDEAPIKKEEVEPAPPSEPKPDEKPEMDEAAAQEPPEPAADKEKSPAAAEAKSADVKPGQRAEAAEAKTDDVAPAEAMEVDEEKDQPKDAKEPSPAR